MSQLLIRLEFMPSTSVVRSPAEMREAIDVICVLQLFIFRKALTGLQNQSNVLISGAGDVRERNTVGILRAIRGIFVSQFQEGQAAFIGLFFHPIGSKDLLNHFLRKRSDIPGPAQKTVGIPFAVELMVLRHVIRICRVLTHATIQSSVRADVISLITDNRFR